MNELEELKKDIIEIKERNKKVELEKAWEISTTRKVAIIVVTYICASLVMLALGISDPLINAIIPTLGFLLSVQSLPFIKKIWLKQQKDQSNLA